MKNSDYDFPSYKPKDEIHSFVLSPRHSLWNSIFSRNCMDPAVLQVQKQRNGAMQEVQHGRRLWRGKLFVTCIGTSYRLIWWPLPDVPWYFTSVQSACSVQAATAQWIWHLRPGYYIFGGMHFSSSSHRTSAQKQKLILAEWIASFCDKHFHSVSFSQTVCNW